MNRREAYNYRNKIEAAARQLNDEMALLSVELFPKWKANIDVVAGDRYQYDGVLYRVIQSHTTQGSWTPDITPALFVEVTVDEWPEWRQPIGASDAYNIGDKVSHNNKHWVSIIDGNVWEPGVAGWTEQ